MVDIWVTDILVLVVLTVNHNIDIVKTTAGRSLLHLHLKLKGLILIPFFGVVGIAGEVGVMQVQGE